MESQRPPLQGHQSFLRNVLESMLKVYLNRNPMAKTILKLVQSVGNEDVSYDHFTFRTFGVDGYNIDSLASFFLDYGYTLGGELRFQAKKLKVLWLAPPDDPVNVGAVGSNAPLPRIVIAELLIDELSPRIQDMIKQCVKASGSGSKYAVLSSALGSLPWKKPSSALFNQLARENEYAAWTLVNGYALNHVAISVHRMKSHLNNIELLNQLLEEKGFTMNPEGGVIKVSPDGLLRQISTVAETIPCQFSDGVTELVPHSYIEFTERLVLPQYEDVPETEIKECHRRDGFELESANKIMESTLLALKTT